MSCPVERSEARRCLVGWLAVLLAGCAVGLTPDPTPPLIPPPGATTDADLFEAMVQGVRDGGSYYDVTHKALRDRGYPSRSLFNWRTPALTCMLATIPGPTWGKGLLAVLAALTFGMLFSDLARTSGTSSALVGGIALIGSLAWCLGEKPYLFTDTWSGVLIALSIVLLARGRVGSGVLAGFLALGFRELAMPYVLGSFGYAAINRRRGEAIAWALAIGLYAILMTLHAHQVISRLTQADQTIPGGWIRFGGIRFVLITSQMNFFLMPLPLFATSCYLSVALLGLYRSRTDLGHRAGAILGLYLVAFSLVGAPFNFYWGLITAPLIAVGFTQGIAILPKLIDSALPRRDLELAGADANPSPSPIL